MTRGRRMVAMASASVAVLALGFVVAAAAGALPGGGDEAWLDLPLRAELDLSPLLAWTLLMLAMLGAVLFALGLRQHPSREQGKRRGIFGALIGLVLFVVIARWLRPAVEALLGEGTDAADAGNEVLGDDRGSVAGGWILTILLAAVLAAALTRIGLSITAVPAVFRSDEEVAAIVAPNPDLAEPVPHLLGEDPRSRVLAAYEDFENRLAVLGRPRRAAETTARHARRASGELNLDITEVEHLVGHHSRARYGGDPPSSSDARAAEQSAARLRSGMGE